MKIQGQKVLFADTRVDGDVKDVLRYAVREFDSTLLEVQLTER